MITVHELNLKAFEKFSRLKIIWNIPYQSQFNLILQLLTFKLVQKSNQIGTWAHKPDIRLLNLFTLVQQLAWVISFITSFRTVINLAHHFIDFSLYAKGTLSHKNKIVSESVHSAWKPSKICWYFSFMATGYPKFHEWINFGIYWYSNWMHLNLSNHIINYNNLKRIVLYRYFDFMFKLLFL